MQSEGPYISGLPDNAAVINKKSCISYTGLERRSVNAVCGWMNEAYAEGRKSMEKEIEENKAIKDALLCGTGFVMEGKRVPPEDVYLSETEIKLQKVEKEFKELLSIAQELCDDLGDDIAEKFRDWKKARVI